MLFCLIVVVMTEGGKNKQLQRGVEGSRNLNFIQIAHKGTSFCGSCKEKAYLFSLKRKKRRIWFNNRGYRTWWLGLGHEASEKSKCHYFCFLAFFLLFLHEIFTGAKWRIWGRKTQRLQTSQAAFGNSAGDVGNFRRRRLDFPLPALANFYSRKWHFSR